MSMDLDIALIVNEEKFVKKYSFIYTFIISIILLAPLYVYVDYNIKLHEIKMEIELKSIQEHVVRQMDNFGNHPNETFEFPQLPQSKSGLYKEDFSVIYTQVNNQLPSYVTGYDSLDSHRYLISKLPSKKYFFAQYLVTEKDISFSSIFLEASLIAFGIIMLILLLSFYFLKSFSRPFQRVNEKLDDFIKESIHEINTPLSIINVNVDLFDSIYGKNKYFNRIKSATKSLATIYDDMDYLIKQNRIEYKSELINFNEFMQERVSYFELICHLKEITVSFDCAIFVELYFNPTKLQRIVDNTLSNAIKFSEKNSIIRLTLINKENDVVLSVKDYGKGIQNPQKILEKYYREDEQKSGFGIGMNIVKSIIDESNISLEIKSKRAQGSEFIYTFHSSIVRKIETK
ncbi:MAG: two-component system OmpR family sensor kinase [Sulfurimonas sp.]|jgi:two-component system OmpR family sensor kinase|uniref:sensor histidine kinase n=1 Tax=Sulfurimonas sp. TaxID=2022749 RepID=UPI0039E6062B